MSGITGTDFQPLTEELSACQLCAGKQQANLPGADGAAKLQIRTIRGSISARLHKRSKIY